MPILNLSVRESAHDGHATWADRANVSGTIFNTALQSGLGTHFNESLILARFFIFRFGDGSPGSGLPQGTLINSAKLNLRFNNGVGSSILHNHVYICVENNLDPTGTGAILNGAGNLGRQAYQRLGRQTAATDLFGPRCGPTHTGNLSTTGRGVRDSQAYVYKAFGDSRDLAAAQYHLTDDFGGALQALVNDPSWNPHSQYVMVHMFSDGRISAGSTLGVGYLGGITWASGQTGSTGEGNGPGGAQIFFYDQSNGALAAQLEVDYTSTTLNSIGDGSISSGNSRLRPVLPIGRIRGHGVELAEGEPYVPVITTGSQDLPMNGMSGVVNPNDGIAWNSGFPIGATIKWAQQRAGRVDGRSIAFNDYAGQAPQAWWDIGTYQHEYATRSTYSLRFYHRYDGGAFYNIFNSVVIFSLNGVEKFMIEHRDYAPLVPFGPVSARQLRIKWPGSDPGWTDYQFDTPPNNDFYRYEVQVDQAQNPKVRVRVYYNDSTTPIETFSANPPDVEMNRVTFGDTNAGLPYIPSRMADVEIWTDYLLNRQYPDSLANTVGTPYIAQPWTWYEYNGEDNYRLMEDLGTIGSVDNDGNNVVMASPVNPLTYEDYWQEVWDGDSDGNIYDLYANLGYGAGNQRRLDLYIPKGTPPEGGWPVIMWIHGGFWISGTRGSIPNQFVVDCILKGFAVASCSYVLGGMYFQALGQTYPAWDPNIASGRYPTFILNVKEAANWLKTNASNDSGGNGNYNINGTKLISTGHSAGGYNALGAVVSRGITNDGSGRNLTLAGNTATFGTPNAPDPVFLGAYVFAGPVDLDALKAWDPTNPGWPLANTGVGTINATARLFMGNRVDVNGGGITTNTSLSHFIEINAMRIPSVCYAWGTADHLVVSAEFTPHSQQRKLAEAFANVAGSLPVTTTYEGHEIADALHHTINTGDFDNEHFFRWLDKLPGLQIVVDLA